MMAKNLDEKEPLISLSQHRTYNINQNNNGSNSLKALAHSERITYTWSGINVFAPTSAERNGRFFDFVHENTRPNPQGKQILKNVRGIAHPGELLAIMGSSGAGKTTLMDVLTSRSSASLVITGLRCINGIPITSDELISKMAYVQQDDLFIGTLTVKEHLIFQALLRMDKHVSYQHRMDRVQEVITELGLGKCENTLIGIRGRIRGISGGEMKRLSFAAEVITNPSLMFCDEPTSGLDSYMASNIIQVLRRLAQLGKTIVCTIHQPSSQLYTMFDKILLLAEGRVAFLGVPREAEIFFASVNLPCPPNYNPADHLVQSLAIVPGKEESCKETVGWICDEFERSDNGTKLATETAAAVNDEHLFGDYFKIRKGSPYKASWCAQFRAVVWRSWLSVIKNPWVIRMSLIQTIIIAIIVSLIYFGQTLTEEGVMSINGVIYLLLGNMTVQFLFSAVAVFSSEMSIFLRDHRRGMYRTDVYFLSKNIANLPLNILAPLFTICISYYIVGLNPDPVKFVTAAAITILVMNSAVSFGYMISCMSDRIDITTSIAAVVSLPMMLFSGFFISIDNIPKYFRWLTYLSWIRYGFESLMVNQWTGIEHINCTNSVTCPRNGQMVLDKYYFSADDDTMNISCLLAYFVGCRIIAYILLLLKTYTSE